MTELGPITEYGELRSAISRRARELGLRHLEVDDLAGLQSGYTSKLICGLRHFGPVSFSAILGALQVELVLRERGEQRPVAHFGSAGNVGQPRPEGQAA